MLLTLRRALLPANFYLTHISVHNLPVGFTDVWSSHFFTTSTNTTIADTKIRVSIENIKATAMKELRIDVPV